MKPKTVASIVIVAVLVVVGAVQLKHLSKPTIVEPPPRAAAPPKSTPAPPVATPEPAKLVAAPTPTPGPEKPIPGPMMDTGGPGYEAMDEPYLTTGAVQEMLERYGLELAYKIAKPDHRRDILDYLSDMDQLRSSLPTVIGLEKDPDLRAYMLETVLPIGLFDDPVEGQESKKDMELVALLRQEPATPQNGAEWVRRMNLARLIDTPSALDFARDSARRFPDDKDVAVVSAEAILAASASGSAPEAEGRRAQEAIVDLLSAGTEEGLRAINSDYRLRAYMTMATAPDGEAAIAFLKAQYERETDPRLRKALEKILPEPKE